MILLFFPLVVALMPPGFMEGLPSLCLVRNLTGMECPGCGISRAVWAVCRGEPAKAWGFNRAIVVVFPLLAVAYFKYVKKLAGIWSAK
jgi:hypothetical protein